MLLACALPAQALQLESITRNLSPEETAASTRVLDAVQSRLPDDWSRALGRVTVDWRDDLPEDVHGRAIHGRILLRRALLAAAQEPGPKAPPNRAARAALVHELAHLYDQALKSPLSRDPRLLDLAGWQVAALRPGRSRNAFTDRSPDPYELSDPGEFLAVNLEYFLLDADYACRRPALSRYFAAHFHRPSTVQCDPALPFVQADPDADLDPLLALDPGRVYAIDYLLAEGNDRPMSRWGHSMLRLVVCAPGRPRGPDCRYDLAYHRVLSFRAFVDDVQVSSWRGLTGSYPARLFLLSLQQVIDEYNKVELRGVQSVPLRLQREEIAAILERAAQVHWSYDGRYWFLSNNCAVETYKLLHDSVPRLADARLSSITPTGLLKRLEGAGIADGSVLDDRSEAMRQGYYFESAGARYQGMFDVARAALPLPYTHVGQWLDLPPQDRAAWFDHADLRASAALLLLEQAALRRQELKARDELKHRLLGRHAQRQPQSQQARAKAHEALLLEGRLSRPALLLADGGYGLPQPSEQARVSEQGRVLATQWQRERRELLAQARTWLPEDAQADLAGAEANIARLGQQLRRLHEPRFPSTTTR